MNAPASIPQQGVRVAVRNLRRSFDGQPVLKGLNFEVERGEIFVVMGPSGGGKSVLLKHIIGLELPEEGEILIEDESIQAPGVMDKYRMAMVFQSGALLNSLTVAENVGLYLSEHRLKPPEEIARIVTEKLEIVGLKGQENRFPAELSGELDPLIAVTIGNEILKLNRRIHVTSFVVTHDRDFAFGVADRIALMVEGQILMVGKPAELRSSPNPSIQRFLTADFNRNQERTSS